MMKLPINTLIHKEFYVDKFYSVDDIFKIFANHYGIELEEFKFLNRDKQEISDILNGIFLDNESLGNIKKENGRVIVNKIGIWKLFLKVNKEIELSDKKIKLTKKEFEKLVDKNKENIMKIINKYKIKNNFLIDETDVVTILSAIFSKEIGYYFDDGGKDNITNILKNKVNSKFITKYNKFIISKEAMIKLIDKLYDIIELQKEKFYSIRDVLERLNYPARLESYYLDEPWIYHDDNMWIKYDKTHIQDIIREDYIGEKEFFKIGNWRIYGSDEEYKDSEGRHTIKTFLRRPEGYKENAGVLEYLMNATYCRYLIIELEKRKLEGGYKYSLSNIEYKLTNLPKETIINYSEKILKEFDEYYKGKTRSIIRDNQNRINNYVSIIDNTKKLKSLGILPKIDKVNELKKLVSKLQKIKYKNQDLDNLIDGIKELIKSENDKTKYIKNCAKRLYNNQIKLEKNFRKISRKSCQLQGECNKIVEEINKEILRISTTLNKKDLGILELLFDDVLIQE